VEKELSKMFKALGEPTRLKIIKMLSLQGMCVCELSETLDMLQPRISQHLKVLKEAGLIKEKKEGYWVCYSLDRDKIRQNWDSFNLFLNAGLKELGYEDELKRLGGLAENEDIKKIKNILSEKSKKGGKDNV